MAAGAISLTQICSDLVARGVRTRRGRNLHSGPAHRQLRQLACLTHCPFQWQPRRGVRVQYARRRARGRRVV
jgi:hypothetical protein